jgi:hypothetical protein
VSTGHNATNPARPSGCNGAEAACPAVTTPTLHRDPSGREGRIAAFPSNPTMFGLACSCGHNGPAGRVRVVTIGCGSERSTEHDGSGPTCPSDTQEPQQRALRSTMACDPGCPSVTRAKAQRVRQDQTNHGLRRRSRRQGSSMTGGFPAVSRPTDPIFRLRFGQAVREGLLCGRTFERYRSPRKAVIDWRGNGRRASGTERCTAPREGKALKGATPRALLA